MQQFNITRMTKDEVSLAIDWAEKEGWNPGINDATCFYAADPNGFFAGKLNGEIIVIGSAVIYDKNFAFCGLYITKPEFRHSGYGIQLTQARLAYVGNRVTGIDGVVNMTAKYEKIGYKPAYKNIRYCCENKITNSVLPEICELKTVPFEQILLFDRKYFPAPRTTFLQAWINQKTAISLGYLDKKKLLGYGIIRKCQQGYKIGPLFAISYDIAQALFEALTAKVATPFFLDVPEINDQALRLVDQYTMQEVFSTIRMYRNGSPLIDLNGVFGITSFELG